MTALGIRYLCGWAVATDPASYRVAEWPPHPARVFMALAAAHFETAEADGSGQSDDERAALEWLERQPPPAITASPAERPEPLTSFVPVNDPEISARTDPATASQEVITSGTSLLPERRSRQPRTFPRAIPHEDTVWLMWDGRPPPDVSKGLDSLARKVTRVGHSSSLVQAWVEVDGDAPEPTLVPVDENAGGVAVRLRVPGPGLLDELGARFEADLRPTVSLWQGYRAADASGEIPHSDFHPELFVVRLRPAEPGRSTLPLAATHRVIHGFRSAMISVATEPVPEVLSGHRRDGSPSRQTHVGFLPLPFVDHRQADGHLVGLGLALPRAIDPSDRTAVLEALGRLTTGRGAAAADGKLRLGALGCWSLEPVGAATMPWSLRSESWARPAAHWASVTPVVFDRFSNDPMEKREIIADSCERIGLPRPAGVRFSHVSPFLGAPPAPEFGPLDRRGGRPVRPFTHVILSFTDDESRPLPVGGPVLIGAGRYRGYGVLRPYDPRRSHPWTP